VIEPQRRAPGRFGLAWAIATFFGVGHFPFASGTVATAAAIPVFLAGYQAGGHGAVLALCLFFTVAGVAAAGVMEARLGYHDPSEVVVDEVAGYLLTMLWIDPSISACAAGFVLFRVLDVLKPWPANRAEQLPGGWGIMADDLVCGAMGNLVLRLGIHLVESPPWR
jgi:phosphatidylglycerophosphatase A